MLIALLPINGGAEPSLNFKFGKPSSSKSQTQVLDVPVATPESSPLVEASHPNGLPTPAVSSPPPIKQMAAPSPLTTGRFTGVFKTFLDSPPKTNYFPFQDPEALANYIIPYERQQDLEAFFFDMYIKIQKENKVLSQYSIQHIRNSIFPLFFLMSNQGRRANLICQNSDSENLVSPRYKTCKGKHYSSAQDKIVPEEKTIGFVPNTIQFPSFGAEGKSSHPLDVHLALHPLSFRIDEFNLRDDHDDEYEEHEGYISLPLSPSPRNNLKKDEPEKQIIEDPENTSYDFPSFTAWAKKLYYFIKPQKFLRISNNLSGGRLPVDLLQYFNEEQQAALKISSDLEKKQNAYLDLMDLMRYAEQNVSDLFPDLRSLRTGYKDERSIGSMLLSLTSAFAYDVQPILKTELKSMSTDNGETVYVSEIKDIKFLAASKNITYKEYKDSPQRHRAINNLTVSGTPEVWGIGRKFFDSRQTSKKEYSKNALEKYNFLNSFAYVFNSHVEDPTLTYLEMSQVDPDYAIKAMLLMRESLREKLQHALSWRVQFALALGSSRQYERDFTRTQKVISKYLSSVAEAKYRSQRIWLKAGMFGATVVVGAITGGAGVPLMMSCGTAAAGYIAGLAIDECIMKTDASNVQMMNLAVGDFVRRSDGLNYSDPDLGMPYHLQLASMPPIVSFSREVLTDVKTHQQHLCETGSPLCFIESCNSTCTSEGECSVDLGSCTQSGLIAQAGSQTTSSGLKIGVKAAAKRQVSKLTTKVGERSILMGITRFGASGVEDALAISTAPRALTGSMAEASQEAAQSASNSAGNLAKGIRNFGIGIALGFLESYMETSLAQGLVVDEEIWKSMESLFSAYQNQVTKVNQKKRSGIRLNIAERYFFDFKGHADNSISYQRFLTGTQKNLLRRLSSQSDLGVIDTWVAGDTLLITEEEKAQLAYFYAQIFQLQFKKDYWKQISDISYVHALHYYVDFVLSMTKYYLMLRRLLCELGPGKNYENRNFQCHEDTGIKRLPSRRIGLPRRDSQ
jgi:hypothetical protein